jgi:hypothetical protein
MEGKRAQIAMEYMVLTAFILIAVAVIFSFSFLNYSQNIRVAKSTDALSKIANAVDDVYTRGEGNTRFVKVSFPEGLKTISIVQKCNDGSQGSLADCGGSYGDVDFSAISMEVQFFSGDTVLLEGTRAKISETLLGGMDETNAITGLNAYGGNNYTVKVSWTDAGLIQIEKV